MKLRNSLALVLALVAASAVVVWGLDSPPQAQDVLAGSGRSVTMWTVGPMAMPSPKVDEYRSLRLALRPPGSEATALIDGHVGGMGPVFVPDDRPMELELYEEGPSAMGHPPVERSVARVPLRTGEVALGDGRIGISGVALALTPGDPEAVAKLRGTLQTRELAALVAEASSDSPKAFANPRVWQVRLYPTQTTTFAEVFVVWELSEEARMMTRMVLPGNLGVRLVCEATSDGLQVLPTQGWHGFPSEEAGVRGWASLSEGARARVEAFLRR